MMPPGRKIRNANSTTPPAGISRRNRDGTDGWPIPQVARRQAGEQLDDRVDPGLALRHRWACNHARASASAVNILTGMSPRLRPRKKFASIRVAAEPATSIRGWETAVAAQRRIVGFDVTELAPDEDDLTALRLRLLPSERERLALPPPRERRAP